MPVTTFVSHVLPRYKNSPKFDSFSIDNIAVNPVLDLRVNTLLDGLGIK